MITAQVNCEKLRSYVTSSLKDHICPARKASEETVRNIVDGGKLGAGKTRKVSEAVQLVRLESHHFLTTGGSSEMSESGVKMCLDILSSV